MARRSGALIGYARVSTSDQDMRMQLDALKRAGCREIFRDVASGAKSARQGLDDALAYLRPGDTLVVWKIDRLGVAARKQNWPCLQTAAFSARINCK